MKSKTFTEELKIEIKEIIEKKFNNIINEQDKEIEELKTQIKEKYSNEEYVLIERREFKKVIEYIEEGENGVDGVENELSGAKGYIDDAEYGTQSIIDYFSDIRTVIEDMSDKHLIPVATPSSAVKVAKKR